jgi:hypothetical protein
VSPTTPFQMLGDPAAAACVGDVCEIPQDVTNQASPAASDQEPHNSDEPAHLSEHALVNRQLDENRV